MRTRRVHAFVAASILVAAGCKTSASDDVARLQDVTVVGGELKNVLVEIVPQASELAARFYYDDAGAKHYYESMFDGSVTAVANGGVHSLYYRDPGATGDPVLIGTWREERRELRICDRYELPSGGSELFACNATFFNPGFSPSPLPEGFAVEQRYTMDLSLGNPSAQAPGLSLTSGAISLESFAQNQINQYGTATCAYNAATGVMEILAAMSGGRALNLSEPYYLAYAPSFSGDTSWFWEQYERMGADGAAVLGDADLPVAEVYRPGVGFGAAQSRAKQRFAQTGGARLPAPAGMKAHKIFFNAAWQGGYMRSTGRTGEQDYKATVDWFVANEKPVNLHYWINGIWHSVIMIGYDPATGQVMIKDSLGNTHLKGSWKSKAWFLRYAYAAVGVTLEGAVLPPVDTGGGDVGGDEAIDPATLANRYRVAVQIGARSGRYRQFTLSVEGAAADLDRITEVRYDVHPTFGQAATKTVSTRADNFRLGDYYTFANGWSTRGTTLRVKVGDKIHDVKLPGSVIGW
jgi:hypothetical protein